GPGSGVPTGTGADCCRYNDLMPQPPKKLPKIRLDSVYSPLPKAQVPPRFSRWWTTSTNSTALRCSGRHIAMRVRLLAFVPLLTFAVAAYAAERPDVKGLFLLADFPAVAIQPGTTTNIPIKLQNLGLAPERFQLSVTDVP